MINRFLGIVFPGLNLIERHSNSTTCLCTLGVLDAQQTDQRRSC